MPGPASDTAATPARELALDPASSSPYHLSTLYCYIPVVYRYKAITGSGMGEEPKGKPDPAPSLAHTDTSKTPSLTSIPVQLTLFEAKETEGEPDLLRSHRLPLTYTLTHTHILEDSFKPSEACPPDPIDQHQSEGRNIDIFADPEKIASD